MTLEQKTPLILKKVGPSKLKPSKQPWKILIVDDEISVHQVTSLALQDFEFADNGLEFLSAYSAREAMVVLREHQDIALILLDVVMETDQAGLQLVKFVRETLNNHSIRIILRTGQPGAAPERQVIAEYDINDYKEKTELTANKLFTAVYSALRTYRDIQVMEVSRKGLESIIEATGTMFKTRDLSGFAQGVLEQLTSLLFLGPDAVYCQADGLATVTNDGTFSIVAGTGRFACHIGQNISSMENSDIIQAIYAAHGQKTHINWDGNIYAAYLCTDRGYENIVCVQGSIHSRLHVTDLILLFLRNVSIALENVCLNNDLSQEIVERREAEKSAAILARLPGELPEPVIRIDNGGKVTYANAASESILRHLNTEVGETLNEPWRSRLAEICQEGQRFNTEIEQEGRVYSISFFPIPEAYYLNVFGRDITDERHLMLRLEHAAFHDPLTDLYNRVHFKKSLEQSIVMAQRYKNLVGLMLIDLDDFKRINDTWGHDVGDKVLNEIADRLRKTQRSSDLITRLGGDEFSVLLPRLNSREELTLLGQRILMAINCPVENNSSNLPISCSIGLASFPDDATSADELQRCADLAMYYAKQEGKAVLRFYDGEIHRSMRRKTQMELLLHHALNEGWFEVHYQPLVRLDDSTIIGAEALLRLHEPGKKMIYPGYFIGVAEDMGLIEPITFLVLERVCSDLQDWSKRGFALPIVAINVSVKQFVNENLPGQIEDILMRFDIQPHQIELEITESVLMGDDAKVSRIIEKLRSIGLTLSIDDFGTGFSSLSYLRRLPVSKLKIDRSFISDMLTSKDSAAIIDAILSLGNSLRLRVLAEGIEDKQQAEFLWEKGCLEGQGYYFGKPMPKEAFEKLLLPAES